MLKINLLTVEYIIFSFGSSCKFSGNKIKVLIILFLERCKKTSITRNLGIKLNVYFGPVMNIDLNVVRIVQFAHFLINDTDFSDAALPIFSNFNT